MTKQNIQNQINAIEQHIDTALFITEKELADLSNQLLTWKEKLSTYDVDKYLADEDAMVEDMIYQMETAKVQGITTKTGLKINANFINLYHTGKLFFAQERLMITDFNNNELNSLDIIEFVTPIMENITNNKN